MFTLLKYRHFKREALGKQCRECVNERYELQLRREDCLYWIHPVTCIRCGQLRNIVMDIEPMRRWKIWLLKEKG